MWRDLSIGSRHPGPGTEGSGEMVKRFRTHNRKKTERPDALLDFVLKTVTADMTVIDIGAGTGRWSIPLARVAKKVTAIEPSPAMAEMLRENMAGAGLNNIDVVSSSWEEAVLEPHDIVVCAHSMYNSSDLELYVRRMEQYARKACSMAMRLPIADGIVGELMLAIHGRFHDSPNAVIAYNALNSIGIYVNVFIEDAIVYWTNNTLEEAFDRARRHLSLPPSDTGYDKLIRDTLEKRLIKTEDGYRWPDGMRSALLWWNRPAPH